MPPIWSKGKCYIVSIDQLTSWHKLKKDDGGVAVLSQDGTTGELHVLADRGELTIVNAGRVDTVSPRSGRTRR